MKELSAMSVLELLQTSNAVMSELGRRKVIRTQNNLVGDYAEWLVCEALGLEAQPNSKASFDAIDGQDNRYQIKGRRSDGTSIQFSTIRNLEQRGFDFLIVVAFHGDYSVRFAVKVPYEEVTSLARWQEHVRGHNVVLTDASVNQALEQGKVEDIRSLLDNYLMAQGICYEQRLTT